MTKAVAGPVPTARVPGRRRWTVLVIAWALVLLPLAGFATLAEDVAGGGVLPFDAPVMLWLHARSRPGFDLLARIATELGGLVAVPVVALLLAGLLWRRGRGRAAVLIGASVLGSALFNTVLKLLFRRSRPDFWRHLVVENSWSFPSGHAMALASLALAGVVLTWRTRRRWPVVAVAAVYVTVVGLSRMYLGVHYPSDVLAGWCVAAAWVAVVTTVLWLTGGRSSGPAADGPVDSGTGAAVARRYPEGPYDDQ